MLYHRNVTEFEDMYWFDINSKKIITKKTNSMEERQISYGKEIFTKLKKHNSILTMHTHPNSLPPSLADFNCNYYNNYQLGLIICHNGTIYKYNTYSELDFHFENDYYINIKKKKKNNYNEINIIVDVLLELKNYYPITFEEVLL